MGVASVDSRKPAEGWANRPGWRRAYARLAGHAPLAETLKMAAELAWAEWPEAAVIVFELRDGRLLAHPAPGWAEQVAKALDGLAVEAAPWWEASGVLHAVRTDEKWGPLAGEPGLKGIEWCWSRRILTAAGEVVGTLTALLPQAAGRAAAPEEGEEGSEAVAEFAALAIEQAHFIEELRYQAQHDAVTGLWTRHHFERKLAEWMEEESRGRAGAFLLVELDGWGRVSEILGGETADGLAKQAAERLRAVLRSGDMIGRAGEHEFHVLLPELSDGAETAKVAARIRAEMKRPFLIAGHEIAMTCSIGMCVVLPGGDEEACIVRKARAALARARQAGGGGWAVYEPSLNLLTPERLELERRLRRAAERGQLRLFYQPQVRVADRTLSGVEALLRWHDPEVGLVSPATFIPIAEESGMILEIGAWVMREAMRQAKAWAERGRALRVGINVSAAQIEQPGFALEVEKALDRSGVEARLVELEITESTLLSDARAAVEALRRLRARGVQIALDDFGTGHSSLSYLRELPVQRLKIDRAFLAEAEVRPDLPLLASIVRMAHGLGLPVIVEGVEDERQWEAVAKLGCDEVQGYLVGRPMPAGQLEEWAPA
jgi:diguanylate cyclase (GGDEF)-like protein